MLEVADLRLRLAEVQDILRAIRESEVDALVVHATTGEQVYELGTADHAYRHMVEQMREGAATLAPDGTVLFANQQLRRLLHADQEALVGQPLDRWVSVGDKARVHDLLQRLDGGRLTAYLLDQHGDRVQVSLSASRILVDQQSVVLLLVTDLTYERQADRVSRLLQLALRLSVAVSQRQVGEAVTNGALHALDAIAGFVARSAPDGSGMELLHAVGFSEARLEKIVALLAEPEHPIADAVRTRDVILIETAAERRERYPQWPAPNEGADPGALMAVPMLLPDAVMGGLHICFAGGRQFELADREFALTVAQHCAQALERASLYSELEERVEARTLELRQANAQLAHVNASLQAANRQLEEANQRLTQAVAQRQAVQRQLEQSRENERVRMARELHDELGGRLTVLKFDLSRVLRDGALSAPHRQQLIEFGTEIDEAIQAVRRLSSELHPHLLVDLGLKAALEAYFGDFTKRTGLAGDMVCLVDDLGLTGERAAACFRICQEALTNVARHAEATRVTVTIEAQGDGLSLCIADDGRGTDATAAATGGLGLVGMRERASLLGAELRITSAPRQGTTVHLFIPGQAPEPAG